MDINLTSINKNMADDGYSEIPCLQFDSLLAHDKLGHMVFTRKGGVSKAPYDSLNVSFNTGDLHDNVEKNIDLARDRIGAGQIISMNQVHGTEILTLHKDIDHDQGIRTADAIITNVPRMGLLVKQADCQGVIIYDRIRSVVAVVHCGWRGNVQDILGVAVKRMEQEYGCMARDLLAAIGPSLGPCCAEFKTYMDIFPEEFTEFNVGNNHFNLWEISRMQLLRSGLMNDNIETADVCTKCNTDLFFSYRAEGNTGRFGTVAMLK